MEGLNLQGVAPRSSFMDEAFSDIVLQRTRPAPPGRSSSRAAAAYCSQTLMVSTRCAFGWHKAGIKLQRFSLVLNNTYLV